MSPTHVPILVLLAVLPMATAPGESETLWLLGRNWATTQVASTTLPAEPFAEQTDDSSRPGKMLLSNGKTLAGPIRTTRDKPLRIWVESRKEYQDIPFADVRSLKATVVWERLEQEWQFKTAGSDEKVYSGKSYPARELQYEMVLVDGTKLVGSIVAPLYVKIAGGDEMLLLNKRQKGALGETLAELTFVSQVTFD